MVVVPEYEVSHYPYTFDYRKMTFTLENQGIYQIQNARLALTIASKLITLNEVKTKKAVESALWKGRFEILRHNGKKVILDGAHNKQGILALIQSLKAMNLESTVIIFTCLKDKNIEEMISLLEKTNYPLILTNFNDERHSDLHKYVKNKTKYIENYHDALKTATLLYDNVLVTGSLHFISNVRSFITK